MAGRERLLYAGVGLAAAAALLVGALLTPDPRGLGTHEQLGLPPCTTAALFGIPCPFCGMTTAFALMAHGRYLDAVHAQPAGAAAFVFSVLAVPVSLGLAVTRTRVVVRRKTVRRALAAAVVALVAGAWVYKLVTMP